MDQGLPGQSGEGSTFCLGQGYSIEPVKIQAGRVLQVHADG
jgi:putative hemolysin